MAAALLQALHPKRIYVASAGVRAGAFDPLVAEVLDEVGIDLTKHYPQSFEQLEDDFFDVVISLSAEAQHWAVEFSRDHAVDIEYWRVHDPSLVEGSRTQRLDAYRALREMLHQRIYARFPTPGGPVL